MQKDDAYERMKQWEAEQAKAKKAPKPKATGANGPNVADRLKDENLRLAVVDALVESGALDLDLESLTAADDYKPDPKIRKRLLGTRLDEGTLARVTSLEWEGGCEIQSAIWPQWDGEDDYFDIRALDGIELLAKCRAVLFIACANIADLRPLLEMKALKKLTLPRTPTSAASKKVLATLAQRGVAIR